MRTARRERERAARRDAEQPPLGVEQVQQREQVVLTRAATVEEDEQPLRLAARGTRQRGERHERSAARGFGSGVSIGSRRSRRCSNAGGSDRRSPRDSSGSSVAKPGPSVAISNRIPFGSRK